MFVREVYGWLDSCAFVECGQKTENYGSDVHSYIFRTAEVTYIAVRICTGMDLYSPM